MSIIVENGINRADYSEPSSAIHYSQPLTLAYHLFFLTIGSKVDWHEFHSVSLSVYNRCGISCNEHSCQVVICGEKRSG